MELEVINLLPQDHTAQSLLGSGVLPKIREKGEKIYSNLQKEKRKNRKQKSE